MAVLLGSTGDTRNPAALLPRLIMLSRLAALKSAKHVPAVTLSVLGAAQTAFTCMRQWKVAEHMHSA